MEVACAVAGLWCLATRPEPAGWTPNRAGGDPAL